MVLTKAYIAVVHIVPDTVKKKQHLLSSAADGVLFIGTASWRDLNDTEQVFNRRNY